MNKLVSMIYLAVCCSCFCRCDITDGQIQKGSDEPDIPPTACSILFIGSSYFSFNDLPKIVESFCRAAGDTVFIGQEIVNGTYLDYHASSPAAEEKINERPWDYVVLQGVGTNTAYPEVYTAHPVLPALKTLKEKIEAASPCAATVFCMPFAFEDGMTWKDGWEDTYSDMQSKIYEYTLFLADSLGLTVAPVGRVWKEVLEEKSFPLHYLHMSDWNHPSYRGSYLMGLVIYSTIFRKSCLGMPYGGTEAEAELFQAAADRIVLDNLGLWYNNQRAADNER